MKPFFCLKNLILHSSTLVQIFSHLIFSNLISLFLIFREWKRFHICKRWNLLCTWILFAFHTESDEKGAKAPDFVRIGLYQTPT